MILSGSGQVPWGGDLASRTADGSLGGGTSKDPDSYYRIDGRIVQGSIPWDPISPRGNYYGITNGSIEGRKKAED